MLHHGTARRAPPTAVVAQHLRARVGRKGIPGIGGNGLHGKGQRKRLDLDGGPLAGPCHADRFASLASSIVGG